MTVVDAQESRCLAGARSPWAAAHRSGRLRRGTAHLKTVLGLVLFLVIAGQGLAADPPGNQTGVGTEAGRLAREAGQAAVGEVERAVARVRPLLERYGYPALFVAVGVEGAGIPAPGQTLLIAAAIDAVDGGLSITAIVVLAVLAATLGNSIGYLIGRAGGRPLLRKLPISEGRLIRVDGLFRRYGGGFILVARFFDGTRQLNGIMAGMLEMSWWRFTFWNLLGAVIWVCVWALGAYWLDRDIGKVWTFLQRIEPFAIALLVIALLFGLVYLLRRRRAGTASGKPS